MSAVERDWMILAHLPSVWPPSPYLPTTCGAPCGLFKRLGPKDHVRSIKDRACQAFRVTFRELESMDRSRRVSRARQWAMWRCREEVTILGKPASYPWIAEQFGRDHSTVIHACRVMQENVTR